MTQNNEPELITFGCRLNTYESEVMRDHAKNAGLENAIIVNTCAVTKEAERQARQAIRRAHKKNPDAKIIVTGCSAQINPDVYAGIKGVSNVVGNDAKLEGATWQGLGGAKVLVNDIMSVKETASHLVEGFEGRARAFIQVQNGCDHRCTFCIIPYGRGNSRSVPIGAIVDQVRTLVAQGYHEIVLTGVDVTSYGPDLPGKPTFGQMIRRVLALVPELPRLRLSSLDPVEIDEDLWTLIAEEPRLMPHLHLSAQAGDDMVLKRMKRRHLRQDILDVVNRARDLRPDIAFGADIIAGFPTETDEMFENTRALIEEADLVYAHIFPYSEREGTPAARMPQVDHQVRKERAAILRETAERQHEKYLKKYMNKSFQIIVEKENFGHTENFIPVHFNGHAPVGALVHFQAESLQDNHLYGTISA
ncbi:MAG: tRNA (N(6)-L-threonylcarbamoyladenosine(37)-C(2))-methylthiotransferase MtaB [Micavibrio sp.]|nr:tRNA (N(6)-L-threonylcarbamoyladenosine(37)-C(2))-methylthiotransferase MtaB [Micavibrio sp.]|tara:strand:+ start:86906 stop:88162 length:1257 start_codon:yes stop_codon:yes gene_type:complete